MDKKHFPESSYTSCRCRDCMETAISDDRLVPEFCWECRAAGCEDDKECCVEKDVYMETTDTTWLEGDWIPDPNTFTPPDCEPGIMVYVPRRMTAGQRRRNR